MEPRDVHPEPNVTFRPGEVLHFTVPVGVPMTDMIRAQQAYLELLREVSRAVARTVDDPVQWVVTKVSEGSADYSIAPRTFAARPLPEATLHEMVEAVPTGLRALRMGTDRPRYFTDRALELTRALTSTLTAEMPSLTTRNGAAEVEITRAVGTHARTILDMPYLSDYGTVEGTLETVNVHGGKRQFVIYDDLNGRRIECHFAHRIASDEIRVERRVAVTGEIRSRENGEIISVIADRIYTFDADDELPTSDDVLGILAG